MTKIRQLKSLFIFISLMLLLACLPGAAFSRGANIDYVKMKRDLNIMKVILDRIMKPDDSGFSLSNGNTRGVFLEGYGVIFIYKYSISDQLIYSRTFSVKRAYEDELIALKKSQNNYIDASKKAKAKIKDTYRLLTELEQDATKKEAELSEMKERAKKLETQLKESIIEFLGDYCDAINQLTADDRITVIILPEKHGYAPFNCLFNDKLGRMKRLIATVKKSDIALYRREVIKKQAFERHIHFSTDNAELRLDRDIQIMTKIIDTALNQYPEKELIVRGETWGTYIDQFGALFMMKMRQSPGILIYSTGEKDSKVVISEQEDTSKPSSKEQIDHIRSTLIELLSNYGHTMRKLDDDEWISLALELKQLEWSADDTPSILFIKVRKRDVDDYNKGKLSLAAFKKRVDIVEY